MEVQRQSVSEMQRLTNVATSRSRLTLKSVTATARNPRQLACRLGWAQQREVGTRGCWIGIYFRREKARAGGRYSKEDEDGFRLLGGLRNGSLLNQAQLFGEDGIWLVG